MSEFAPPRRGEDTDLLCVEISALGGASACTLPKAQCGGKEPALRPDRTQEEFLRSLLTKTEVYRPRQASFSFMGNEGENAFQSGYDRLQQAHVGVRRLLCCRLVLYVSVLRRFGAPDHVFVESSR